MNRSNFRYFKIEDCSQCPFSEATRGCSADDAFSIPSYTFVCRRTHEVVAENVEPFDKFPEIPYTCPLPIFQNRYRM